MSEPHRYLFREQGGRPNREAGGNRSHHSRRSQRFGLGDCRHYRRHNQIGGNTGLIMEGHADIAEHDSAGESGRDGAEPQVTLGMHQLLRLAFPETRFQPMREIGRRLYRWKISEEEERSADFRIVLRAALAFSHMPLHANQLDTGKGIIYKSKVLITKLATIHRPRLRVRKQVPASGVPVPEPTNLIYVWCNDFRERIPCPIEPGFDRAQVALRDLGYLFVGFAFQLPQDKHISVMLG